VRQSSPCESLLSPPRFLRASGRVSLPCASFAKWRPHQKRRGLHRVNAPRPATASLLDSPRLCLAVAVVATSGECSPCASTALAHSSLRETFRTLRQSLRVLALWVPC